MLGLGADVEMNNTSLGPIGCRSRRGMTKMGCSEVSDIARLDWR
jgi:hypothetical protein